MKLKPCYHCGKKAVLSYSHCACGSCPACGILERAEMWNRRPIEDRLRKQIRELKRKLAAHELAQREGL